MTEDEADIFWILGRFFDHCSGSPRSIATRLRYVGDNNNIKVHAEFQINRLAGLRERATARVMPKVRIFENVGFLKEKCDGICRVNSIRCEFGLFEFYLVV